MINKALIIAPHTDDGELGCGATIAKYLEAGKEIHYLVFSTCAESLPKGMPSWTLEDEFGSAVTLLGVKKENVYIHNYPVRRFSESRQDILDDMIKIDAVINPDIIFVPSPNDIHQDHTTVAHEAMRAFKRKCMLGYELPWNNYRFNNDTFSELKKRHVDSKINALKCYRSQFGRSYFQEEYQRGIMRAHGVQIGCEYAEVFETIRWIIGD